MSSLVTTYCPSQEMANCQNPRWPSWPPSQSWLPSSSPKINTYSIIHSFLVVPVFVNLFISRIQSMWGFLCLCSSATHCVCKNPFAVDSLWPFCFPSCVVFCWWVSHRSFYLFYGWRNLGLLPVWVYLWIMLPWIVCICLLLSTHFWWTDA